MFMNHIKILSFALLVLATSCSTGEKQTEPAETKIVGELIPVIAVAYNTVETGSLLEWGATHFGGVGPRSGKIYCKEARVLVEDGVVANASVLIDMSTLTVENMTEEETTDLSGHLMSADFFNVPEHPTSSFELTSLNAITGDYNSEISGSLTIMGISNNVTFNANVDVTENNVSVKSETFEIDRSDWNMVYNAEGSEGVPLDYIISDDIELAISFSVAK